MRIENRISISSIIKSLSHGISFVSSELYYYQYSSKWWGNRAVCNERTCPWESPVTWTSLFPAYDLFSWVMLLVIDAGKRILRIRFPSLTEILSGILRILSLYSHRSEVMRWTRSKKPLTQHEVDLYHMTVTTGEDTSLRNWSCLIYSLNNFW